MSQKIIYLFLFVLCLIDVEAQTTFERGLIDIGNVGMSITNAGTIGRPDVRNTPLGDPSMEYPINSGIEHLFEGGLWIGAVVDGQVAVSTAAIDAAGGYQTGANGFEFSPTSGITRRSSLTSSEFFSLDAISHQDMMLSFSDRFVDIGGIPIDGHDNPLEADVDLESYAWNFSFADFFVILNYTITNNSTSTWDSVYLGLWTDIIIRNINVATDAGTAFFNKGGGGFIDSMYAVYAFDVAGDPGYTESYGASQFLGIEWRDTFFHPSNSSVFVNSGLPAPKVHGNFWNFRSFQGTTFAAPFDADGNFDDVKAYERMKQGFDFTNPTLVNDLVQASNRTQLVSVGPLIEIQPGESVSFAMALVCARQLSGTSDCQLGTTGDVGADKDVPCAREELLEHLGWAKRTFNGEDLNENGILDPGEDLDEDGILDRYILPEPPATPKVHFEVESNNVTIYWSDNAERSIDPISKKQDFEGYRLYRTNPGEEFSLDILGSADLIGQWDNKGNSVGYNNGFEVIRLDQPVYFEDDTTTYWYKYEINGLLNGWQYLFVLTAFDQGDENLRLDPLESSFVENAFRVWPGTTENDDFSGGDIGVYPNPYSLSAAWDGSTARTRKLIFYNLPSRCEVVIYTLSGEIIANFEHSSDTYTGDDILWFDNFGGDVDSRIFSGGEHAWDILSRTDQSITQGVYLFSVKDLNSGTVQQGKFAIVK